MGEVKKGVVLTMVVAIEARVEGRQQELLGEGIEEVEKKSLKE